MVATCRSAGNGLYVLHSCMNHACDPNIEVRNDETNANVHLIAKRPIEPGSLPSTTNDTCHARA
jgi:SET domain-containing protein